MVKPGGTGRPRIAISAGVGPLPPQRSRKPPLPPRRSRKPALPSALPSPKVNTHWPGFMPASFAAGLATAFAGGFATGLVGLFFSAFRAAGAAFRAGVEGFDFAAIFIAAFLDFATALAMAYIQSERGMGVARLTPFWGV